MNFDVFYSKENFANICGIKDVLFREEVASAIIHEYKSTLLFSQSEISSSPIIEAFFRKYGAYWKSELRSFRPDLTKESFQDSFEATAVSFDNAFILHDIDSEALKLNKGLVYSTTNEEVDFFNQFFFQKGKKDFSKDFTIGHDFKRWDDLSDYVMPITDLVIIDQFMFDAGGSLPQFDRNLLACITSLISKTNYPINVILYSRKDKINIPGWNTRLDLLPKRIKERIKEQTGKDISVSIILLGGANIDLLRKMKEHDRTIFSNYYRIILGPSINFIGNDDVLNASARHIEMKSLMRAETRDHLNLLIHDLQNYVNISRDFSTITILGDKKSNFLEFP